MGDLSQFEVKPLMMNASMKMVKYKVNMLTVVDRILDSSVCQIIAERADSLLHFRLVTRLERNISVTLDD